MHRIVKFTLRIASPSHQAFIGSDKSLDVKNRHDCFKLTWNYGQISRCIFDGHNPNQSKPKIWIFSVSAASLATPISPPKIVFLLWTPRPSCSSLCWGPGARTVSSSSL